MSNYFFKLRKKCEISWKILYPCLVESFSERERRDFDFILKVRLRKEVVPLGTISCTSSQKNTKLGTKNILICGMEF